MKKAILPLLALTLVFSACNNNKTSTAEAKKEGETANFTTDDTEKTGSFTVDGKEYKGRISLQTMAKNQFSVLCQQDEPFALLQMIFYSEKEARSNTSLKLVEGFYTMDPGTVQVTLSLDKESKSTESSTGTVSVADNKVTFKDVTLESSNKTKKTVNTTLSF